MASFKISTSMVFLPRSRWSSRIWALRCFTSDKGTTGSSLPTATKGALVDEFSPLKRAGWDGCHIFLATEDMLLPGSSASSTIALSLVPPTNGGVSLPMLWPRSDPYSSFLVIIVITLWLLLQLKLVCMSVRSKRGLLHPGLVDTSKN